MELEVARDDDPCGSTGSGVGTADASGDTQATPWRSVRLTLKCEGGVPVEDEDADERGGEGSLGSEMTCLKTRGAGTVEVDAIQGRG